MPNDYTVLKNIVDHGGVYYFELRQILPQGLQRSKDILEWNKGTPRCGAMT